MLDAFYANPLGFIGLAFALVAAFGGIYFVFGFAAGLPHVFTLNSGSEHRWHHRIRVTWGFSILLALFIVWELVRIVASFFGYPPPNMHAFGLSIGTLAIVLLASGIWVLLTNIVTKKYDNH